MSHHKSLESGKGQQRGRLAGFWNLILFFIGSIRENKLFQGFQISSLFEPCIVSVLEKEQGGEASDFESVRKIRIFLAILK